MTLARFATKNAFRNRRRSFLTAVSISFSLFLLTILMSFYRGVYLDKGSVESQLRVVTRHKVSLVFSLPGYYREKVRAIPGVVHVTPWNWFGGLYKDNKPENICFQFAVDPKEIFQVLTDFKVPPDQLQAFQHDRAGAAVARPLAEKHKWKLGNKIVIKGTIYPVNPELTIRALFDPPSTFNGMFFDKEYLDQATIMAKDKVGTLYTLVDSPDHVPQVSQTIDRMFENSPEPTKTESEKAFGLSFLASVGNVKLFILSICSAVVFTILLVSALVGFISTIVPAYNASRKNIVEGLRHIG